VCTRKCQVTRGLHHSRSLNVRQRRRSEVKRTESQTGEKDMRDRMSIGSDSD